MRPIRFRFPLLSAIRLRPTGLAWQAVVLAAWLCAAPRGAAAEAIRISGTGAAIETIRAMGEKFRKSHPDLTIVIVPGMGSSGGISAALAGKLDIGLSARPITDKEKAAGAVQTEYAWTPLVFGVHRGVRTGGMTLEDVAAIYSGKRTRWEDGSRIRLVLRPVTDSDVPALSGMSSAMSAALETALHREGMIVGMTDQDAADAIANTPGAFGGLTLSIVISEKRRIRVLPLDGVVPTAAALANGTYHHRKCFYMVTRSNPSPGVRRFVEFVRSAAAAPILARNGQVAVR